MAREIEELMEAIQMLEVTGEKIQKWSDGEVTWPGKRLGDKDSLLDPEIFGVLGMLSTRMGHINLPVPVVNVQYLYGKRPILPELLGMSRTEVELFAYGSLYAEFEKKDGKWKLVRKMGKREYVEFSDTDPLKKIVTGGAAIEMFLEDCPEKDKIILHSIPVIPIGLRIAGNGKKYGIEKNYEFLLSEVLRYDALVKNYAPEPVLNLERTKLQEYVDGLIDNGCYGFPGTDNTGVPIQSLREVANYLNGEKDEFSLDTSMIQIDTDGIKNEVLKIQKEGFFTRGIDKYLIDTLQPLTDVIRFRYFPKLEEAEVYLCASKAIFSCLTGFPEDMDVLEYFGKAIYMQLKYYKEKSKKL